MFNGKRGFQNLTKEILPGTIFFKIEVNAAGRHHEEFYGSYDEAEKAFGERAKGKGKAKVKVKAKMYVVKNKDLVGEHGSFNDSSKWADIKM